MFAEMRAWRSRNSRVWYCAARAARRFGIVRGRYESRLAVAPALVLGWMRGRARPTTVVRWRARASRSRGGRRCVDGLRRYWWCSRLLSRDVPLMVAAAMPVAMPVARTASRTCACLVRVPAARRDFKTAIWPVPDISSANAPRSPTRPCLHRSRIADRCVPPATSAEPLAPTSNTTRSIVVRAAIPAERTNCASQAYARRTAPQERQTAAAYARLSRLIMQTVVVAAWSVRLGRRALTVAVHRRVHRVRQPAARLVSRSYRIR